MSVFFYNPCSLELLIFKVLCLLLESMSLKHEENCLRARDISELLMRMQRLVCWLQHTCVLQWKNRPGRVTQIRFCSVGVVCLLSFPLYFNMSIMLSGSVLKTELLLCSPMYCPLPTSQVGLDKLNTDICGQTMKEGVDKNEHINCGVTFSFSYSPHSWIEL